MRRRTAAAAAALGCAVLLALAAPAVAKNQCALTQNCHSYALDSPCHAIPSDKKPTPMNFSAPACPRYKDNACCNHFQNTYLSFNFMLIDAAFGSASAGGCPACAQNIKDLWCEFTCSPDQADFVKTLGIENVTDPETDVVVSVLHAVINIDKTTACSMYDSCSSTVKCRQVQTLKSCNGFLDYQGDIEAIGRGNLLNFNYADDDGSGAIAEGEVMGKAGEYLPPLQFNSSLKFDIAKCNNYTINGVHGACPCGTCEAACAADTNSESLNTIREKAKIDPLHGARWGLIGITYALIFVVSVGILMYRATRYS